MTLEAARALAKGATLSEAILAELTKAEREYVLSMALIDCHSTEYPPVVEPKFSPLTHCALCGKMFASIKVSVCDC